MITPRKACNFFFNISVHRFHLGGKVGKLVTSWQGRRRLFPSRFKTTSWQRSARNPRTCHCNQFRAHLFCRNDRCRFSERQRLGVDLVQRDVGLFCRADCWDDGGFDHAALCQRADRQTSRREPDPRRGNDRRIRSRAGRGELTVFH